MQNTSSRPSGSLGTVSSFDLEPNPFEQSFASTKKTESGGDGGNIGNTNDSAANGDGLDNAKGMASLSYLDSQNNGSSGSLNIDPQIAGDQKRAASLIYGNQRGPMQSPPLLTPGGSKKLPPLLMSPSYLQGQSQSGQNGSSHNGSATGGQTPLGGAQGVANGSETDGQLPGFLMNLFKSGLTPNESNLRANFTPGILGSQFNQGSLPSLMNNNVSISRANSNSVVPTNGDKDESGSGRKMNGQIDIPNKALTALGGLPAGQLTPGLSSLLASSAKQLNLDNNTRESTPNISGSQPVVQGVTKSNSVPTNSYFPLADTTIEKDSGADGADNQSGTQKKRGRKKSVSTKATEPKRKRASTSSASKKSEGNTGTATVTNPEANNAVNTGNDDLDEQERRRQEFLERNRVAASRFRRKKKEYIKKIETDLGILQTEYNDMSKIIGHLAGITPEGSDDRVSASILLMLEQSLMDNDIKAALQIIESTKQILTSSNFVKRNGANPVAKNTSHDSSDSGK